MPITESSHKQLKIYLTGRFNSKIVYQKCVTRQKQKSAVNYASTANQINKY